MARPAPANGRSATAPSSPRVRCASRWPQVWRAPTPWCCCFPQTSEKRFDPQLLALMAGKPVLVARLVPAAAPPAGPQLAFAGIGKPWKMERALKAAGCELEDFAPFPDHAGYDERTLRFLAGRARGGLETRPRHQRKGLGQAAARVARTGRRLAGRGPLRRSRGASGAAGEAIAALGGQGSPANVSATLFHPIHATPPRSGHATARLRRPQAGWRLRITHTYERCQRPKAPRATLPTGMARFTLASSGSSAHSGSAVSSGRSRSSLRTAAPGRPVRLTSAAAAALPTESASPSWPGAGRGRGARRSRTPGAGEVAVDAELQRVVEHRLLAVA